MEQDITTYLVVGLLVLGFLLAAFYFLTRWALSMKRQLWNQQQTIDLLITIAKRLGEPETELDFIKKRNHQPDEFLDKT